MKLAVGFFDGVHLGHQRILSGADAVLTFRNHPLSVLSPSRAPALLMDAAERVALLKTAGADAPRTVRAFRFTRRFASMSPADFAAFLQSEFPGLECVHCGGNWRFGARGEGTPQVLRKLGFKVRVSLYAKCGGCAISSTRIRTALAEGDVALANAMLGRRFSVTGRIVRGKGMGRGLGFPTVNLELPPTLNLKYGVYAVDTPYGRGVANWGVAPTMGENAWPAPVMEVHLLDSEAHFCAKKRRMTVELAGFIRPERKFRSVDSLCRRISADVKAARGFPVARFAPGISIST